MVQERMRQGHRRQEQDGILVGVLASCVEFASDDSKFRTLPSRVHSLDMTSNACANVAFDVGAAAFGSSTHPGRGCALTFPGSVRWVCSDDVVYEGDKGEEPQP